VKLYNIGDRVTQTTYGCGTITLANEYHTIVDFDEHGSRTFVTRMVQLETSNTAAPQRRKATRKRRAV
jgi:hypothetical protein